MTLNTCKRQNIRKINTS